MSTTTAPQPMETTPQAIAPALLVALPPLEQDALNATMVHLAASLRDLPIMVAHIGDRPMDSPFPTIAVAPSAPMHLPWVHTAASYLHAYKLLTESGAPSCLLLGAESWTLAPENLRYFALAAMDEGNDLVLPRYVTSPHDGLVNHAILAPATRSLFSISVHYPQALEIGLSARMAERLASAAQKFTAASQNDALLWPAAEAAIANSSVAEIALGTRSFPLPEAADLTQLLTLVAGSLFSDVEAKATYWQRVRQQAIVKGSDTLRCSEEPPRPDVSEMIETFRLGYNNLSEIWSLVLPPNSLLGLKKLSVLPEETFFMPDALWVRIVYDFLLAWRLRTINRTHLLGALTPLYLAWVASYILGGRKEAHIEALAAAFEADKPYLVSRWRWPDRFNP